MRIIEVTVFPTGETRVQTKGYSGSSCLNASKFLEQALGVTGADQKTGEYFQADQVQHHEENQA